MIRKNKERTITIVIIIAFILYFFIDEYFFKGIRTTLRDITNSVSLAHIISYCIVGIPLICCMIFLHRKDWLKEWDIKRPFIIAFIATLLFVLPMLIGYGVVFPFNEHVTLDRIVLSVFAAGFFEELYFRGFLFGQLFKHTRLGFLPCILPGAILFGMVHLWQGSSPTETFGVFMITFMGAFLFAWLYAEWGFNLWVAILLHMFMNLSWLLFSVSNTALGGAYPNVIRALTIMAAILGTIWYKRNQSIPRTIKWREVIKNRREM